ncbi:MAG: CopD family protein [Candidatus Promineifilaceae bacterium]
MPLEVEVPVWILALSYWVHLVATVIWLGILLFSALLAGRALEGEAWAALRRRLRPWSNLSLVALWLTGFLQMTADENYEGFLNLGQTWAQAILVKHLAVLGMMGFGLYIQWRLHPALERLSLLERGRPERAAGQREALLAREARLLRLNMALAAVVLLCTAVATAL